MEAYDNITIFINLILTLYNSVFKSVGYIQKMECAFFKSILNSVMCLLINQKQHLKKMKIYKTSQMAIYKKNGKVAKKKLEKRQGKNKKRNRTRSTLC